MIQYPYGLLNYYFQSLYNESCFVNEKFVNAVNI
jgi:hypothetical protein